MTPSPCPWLSLRQSFLIPWLGGGIGLLLGACPSGQTGSPGMSEGDAGALPEACLIEAAPADFVYPVGPYGTRVGDTFESFVLDDCARIDVDFADVLASAELVLFSVGAGWCLPCVEETEVLEEEIFRPFCGRGLKVVQVMFETEDNQPATPTFCRSWTDRFGMSFPVLIDPAFLTEPYLDGDQVPLNMLINAQGQVVYRETGVAPQDLAARIDELLPPAAD